MSEYVEQSEWEWMMFSPCPCIVSRELGCPNFIISVVWRIYTGLPVVLEDLALQNCSFVEWTYKIKIFHQNTFWKNEEEWLFFLRVHDVVISEEHYYDVRYIKVYNLTHTYVCMYEQATVKILAVLAEHSQTC